MNEPIFVRCGLQDSLMQIELQKDSSLVRTIPLMSYGLFRLQPLGVVRTIPLMSYGLFRLQPLGVDGFDIYSRNGDILSGAVIEAMDHTGFTESLMRTEFGNVVSFGMNLSHKNNGTTVDLTAALLRIDLAELVKKIPALRKYYDQVKDNPEYRLYEIVLGDCNGAFPWDEGYSGFPLLGDDYAPSEDTIRKYVEETHGFGDAVVQDQLKKLSTQELWRQLHFIDPEIAKAMLELEISDPMLN